MTLPPATVRSILGIPENEPAANALAFIARWREMILHREYGELTIKVAAGRETGWEEHVTHKEGV